MHTFSSDAELDAILKKEAMSAIQQANHEAFQTLVKTVTAFYSGSPKRYVRTGQLYNTPRTSPINGGMGFKAELEDSGGYSTGSKPSMATVLGWAEAGAAGLLGRLYWDEAVREIIDQTDAAFRARFS